MNGAAEAQPGRAVPCAGLAHKQGKAACGPATCLKELQETVQLLLLASVKKKTFSSIFEEFRICPIDTGPPCSGLDLSLMLLPAVSLTV